MSPHSPNFLLLTPVSVFTIIMQSMPQDHTRFLRNALFISCITAFLCTLPIAGRGEDAPKQKHVAAKTTKGRATSKTLSSKKKHRTKRIAVRSAKKGHPDAKINMPPPGHDGQEISDWFMRRRAWPNESIDPNAYPQALAEAARLPILIPRGGKNSIQTASSWQCIGPYAIDGRVSCIATHPTDSNTFYVGAAAGGVWKTTDHGAAWKCVTDTFGMLPTGCLAIDPVQPETIYLGQGEPNQSGDTYPGNGLWKSVDGGASWAYLGFAKSQYIAKILIDPQDHNDIFVAVPGPNAGATAPYFSDSNRGVFRSIDGGATWIRSLFVKTSKSKNANSIGFVDIAMNPVNSGELVAFGWDHSTALAAGFKSSSFGPNTGMWRSTDTGNTWARIDTLTSSNLPNGVKYKVLSRGAVLWTGGGADKKSQTYLFALFNRTDSNRVTHYLTDDNFLGLYRSLDEGVTWTEVLDSTARIPLGGVQGKDSANIMNAQGGYDLFLVGNPHRPEEVYIGGIDVLRSTDYGRTFKNITNSYSEYYAKGSRDQHSDQHGLAFTSAASGADMINVSDGGLFHTTDFGSSWKQMTGLPITMFYSVVPWESAMKNTPQTISASDLRMFGGTQDNGTVAHGLTAASDFSWINAGDGGEAAAHPTDSNKLVTSVQLGVIFARNSLDSLVPSSPSGQRDTTHDTRPRWHNLSFKLLKGNQALTDTTESCSFIPPVVLDEKDPNSLYTARCHVYRAKIDWNDLENTKWYRWSPPIEGMLTNSSTWYYGDIEALAVGVRDAIGNPMLWAGGYNYTSGGSIWRTLVDPLRQDTAAPKWIQINNGLPNSYISCILPDRSDSLTAFATASSAGKVAHVVRTTDGGNSWVNISSNLPSTAPVSAIVVDTFPEHGNPILKNRVLIVASDVGVFVTTNGGGSWSQLGTGMPHIIVSTLKIYKNMLIAATHGRSLYAIDISDLQASSGVEETAIASTAHLQVFPNPATVAGGFQLHFDAPSQHPQMCKLVNESDGMTAMLPIGDEGGGIYRVNAPSSVRAGSYLIQLLNGAEVLASGRVTIVQ